ncbi:TPA: type V toxin-antitoxin system endoribonuclease antitoxin GhoS [Escherichia coli]
MASGDLVRYVITVMLHEDTLTEINELNNYLTRDGFLLTMTDDEGNIHELGTNTFGLISTQSEEELENWFRGLPKVQPAKILKSPSRPGRNGIATENKWFLGNNQSVVCVSSCFYTAFLR